MARLLLSCLVTTALVMTTSSASAEIGEQPSEARAHDTTGLRVEAAAFGLVHARRSGSSHRGGTGAAPGVELGGAYRTAGRWDMYLNARFAYFDCGVLCGPRTRYAALSGGGRWYAAAQPSAVAFFLDLGVRALVLQFDDYGGIGPAAHLGMGVEVFHADRHHRLAFQAGVDVPTFRATRTYDLGGTVTEGYYAVPVTAAGRWTF